jgi:hypothetical protein
VSKTIAICGDSWFSADPAMPGKSFGEVMCDRNSWQLWSLARAGCSNFAIGLQVDKAIELGVDAVVIGATTPDRCEFPIINDQNISIWDRLKSSFNWLDWFSLQPAAYVKKRGISNILHTRSLSATYPWISNPTIISESLNNLMFSADSTDPDYYGKMNSDQLDALRSYMLNLYDHGIKRQTDCWAISDACRRLDAAGIPYLIFIEILYQGNFKKDINWVPEKNLVNPKEFSVWNGLPKSSTTEFHYDTQEGSMMFADYVESRIKDLV